MTILISLGFWEKFLSYPQINVFKFVKCSFSGKKAFNIFSVQLGLKKPYILGSKEDLGPKLMVFTPLKSPS